MRTAALYTSAGILLLSSVAHGVLGWKAQAEALQQINASADLLGGLAAGWLFGSASMAAFGVILIGAARRLSRGDTAIATYVGPIAAAYLIYGVAAFVVLDFEPHFFVFIVPGLLAAFSLIRRG
jgi:hypothetical protein